MGLGDALTKPPRDEEERRPDLFEASGEEPGISAVDKVELPPEEARRQRIRIAIAVVVAIAVVWFLVMLVQRLAYETAFRSAVEDVAEEGRPEEVEEALTFATEEAHPELRARLLGRAGLDGDLDKLAEAKRMLEGQAANTDPDLRIARVYVALADGDPARALAEAQRAGEFGVQAAEFLRARALTLIANGKWAAALNDVHAAIELRDDAAQPAALSALITGELHGPARGLTVYSELPAALRKSPPGLVARARLELASGAFAKAGEVATELAQDDETTPTEQAWAQVILGRVAYERGDLKGARAALLAASSLELKGDERLVLQIAQLCLSLGDTARAEQVLKRLSEGPSSDLSGRVNTLGWWLGQSGKVTAGMDVIKASKAGASSADNGFASFVLAQLKDGARSADTRNQARAHYAQAAKSSLWRLDALKSRATFELSEGDAEAALRVAKQGLESHPGHPLLVEPAVQAYLALGNRDQALAMAKSGIEIGATEPSAHATLALAKLELGDYDAALQGFTKAAELDPSSAQWQAMRGEAARRAASTTAAREAYQKSLALDAAHPVALVGMLTLDLGAGDLEAAGKTLEQIDAVDAFTPRLDAERTQYLVRTGAGAAGLNAVRAALSRAKKDASLRLAAGRLYLQAEQYSRAAATFRRARKLGADARRTHVLSALAYAYAKKFRTANKSLDAAAEEKSSDPELDAWVRVVRAREELADDRNFAAASQAGRAAKLAPDDADVRLAQALVEEARGGQPLPHLRAAASASIPMPLAAGHAALKLGPAAEGCTMAKQYIRAAPRGQLARDVRDILKQCR